MKTKPWILPVFMAATLASIYFLPKAGAVAGSAINMVLPEWQADWELNAIPPSEAELKTLAKDTRFAKAICFRPRPGEYTYMGDFVKERIDLSVVLSGADINNSIHRPERCMPAQGHNITASRSETLALPNGREFPVKRLLSVQTLSFDADHKVSQKFNCVTYYFFVGHDRISNDHLGRTLVDMKDRLVRGMDQRWAYVSVSMWYGEVPWIGKEVTEQEADTKLKAFLADLAEDQIDWKQVVN